MPWLSKIVKKQPYPVILEGITKLYGVQLWRIEHALVRERVHDHGVHGCYVIGIKKQLDIFLNVFYMLFSVSLRREALV